MRLKWNSSYSTHVDILCLSGKVGLSSGVQHSGSLQVGIMSILSGVSEWPFLVGDLLTGRPSNAKRNEDGGRSIAPSVMLVCFSLHTRSAGATSHNITR
jgi:hypothetical protein